MTYGERWATSRKDGRALIAPSLTSPWGLWLVMLDGQLWLCDDSMGGHLKMVSSDQDEAKGITRYQLMNYTEGINPRGGRRVVRRHQPRVVRRTHFTHPRWVGCVALSGTPL